MNILKCIFVYVLFYTVESAKILLINPQYEFLMSHRRFMGSLADLLTANGHDVTMYQPQSDEDVSVTGSSNAKVKQLLLRTNITKRLDVDQWTKDLWAGDPSLMNTVLNHITEIFEQSCESQLKNEDLLKTLKEENFDLGIAEFFDSCGFAIFERIGLKKSITIFTAMIYDNIPQALGLPSMMSYLPSMVTDYEPNMTFVERIKNTLMYFQFNFLLDYITHHSTVHGKFIDDAYYKTTGKKFSVLNRAMSSSYIFVNSEEHLDFPRPISSKIIFIGGFNIKKFNNQVIPKFNDENLLKKTKTGIFLVSFGTVAKTSKMPSKIKKILLESFAHFPDVTFLWKHDSIDSKWDSEYPNVYYQKWFSQNDILGYNDTLGIITHGGLNSVTEIAYSGKPSIAIPLFADQFRNVALINHRKIGIGLKLNELNVEILVKSLNEVINKDYYKKNAEKLAKRMNNKPLSSKERILKYINYTIDYIDEKDINLNDNYNPFDYLDIYGRHLNFIQLYNIDVYVFFAFIVFMIFDTSLIVVKQLITLTLKKMKMD